MAFSLKEAINHVSAHSRWSRALAKLDDSDIEPILRNGTANIDPAYLNCIVQTARQYVAGIFDTLRRYEYDPRLMKLTIVGGGGCLVRYFGDYDASRVTIMGDICATAKGYEYLA